MYDTSRERIFVVEIVTENNFADSIFMDLTPICKIKGLYHLSWFWNQIKQNKIQPHNQVE